jgi:pilus assembly protein Flp/PilA
MLSLFEHLPGDDGGAVAIEYALIAVLISIVIIGACTAVGQNISANFFGPIAAAL